MTLALRDAFLRRGLTPGPMHAFDLTPAMLELFRHSLRTRGIEGVEIAQADLLKLDALPAAWNDYDLIVSASMLEYLPRKRLSAGLRSLRSRLGQTGSLLLFITRRNWLTRPLIGRWWQSNLYDARDLEQSFRYLGLWGHIVEAHR